MSVNEGKIPATLAILTRNSGTTLERALKSAQDFDDIVVCDGGSTDDTLEIARAFGARIIAQDKQFLDAEGRIFDYAGVRNQTLHAAKHNWFFFLDSDEWCGPGLLDAVRGVIRERSERGHGAFWVDRTYVMRGEVINCAATYPNRQMRFFSRLAVEEFIKKIHERIKIKPEVAPEFLDGVMYIPFEPDIEAIRKKWDYQIAVAAAQVTPLSLWDFLDAVVHSAKVSLLWFARLFYQRLFCRGKRMPLKFEMERHYFHIRLLRAFWSEVRLRKHS
ncbi:MAG: glycosyltransferase [Patescibacteria group bacterium]